MPSLSLWSDLMNPDPIPRVTRQITAERHRQLVARRCHDRAVEMEAARRIDGLLDTLSTILTNRKAQQ